MIKCTKKPFKDKRIAKVVKRQLEQKMSKKLDIYRCPICNSWHTTSRVTPGEKTYFRDKFRKVK